MHEAVGACEVGLERGDEGVVAGTGEAEEGLPEGGVEGVFDDGVGLDVLYGRMDGVSSGNKR